MSHHATEDIAIMRSLPNMMVFAPADAIEAEAVMRKIAETNVPCYIRLNKGGERLLHIDRERVNFQVGKALQMTEGSDVCLLASGAIVEEALKAAALLRTDGYSTAVYSFPSIKPIDKKCIAKCAEKYRVIYTIEEHNVTGGFGAAVCETVAESGIPVRVDRIGLKDSYSGIVGTQKFLRHYYGMDSEAIIKHVKEKNL